MNADTLRLWNEAVKASDEKDLEKCLELFQAVPNPTVFILYNSAVVLCQLGRHEEAVQKLTEAIEKNGYMAIVFYRRGSVYFLQKRYKEAIEDFESCGRLFRSSNCIDYMQMGLASKLFLSDVHINSGLCYLSYGNIPRGVELLLNAQTDPAGRNSSVIEKTFSDLNQSKADFSSSLIQLSDVAPLFRPQKNLSEKPIDFLGKSKVIASKDSGSSSDELSEVECRIHIDDKDTTDSGETSVSIPPPPAIPPPRRPSRLGQTPGPSTPKDLHLPVTPPELPPPRSPCMGVRTHQHLQTGGNSA